MSAKKAALPFTVQYEIKTEDGIETHTGLLFNISHQTGLATVIVNGYKITASPNPKQGRRAGAVYVIRHATTEDVPLTACREWTPPSRGTPPVAEEGAHE